MSVGQESPPYSKEKHDTNGLVYKNKEDLVESLPLLTLNDIPLSTRNYIYQSLWIEVYVVSS